MTEGNFWDSSVPTDTLKPAKDKPFVAIPNGTFVRLTFDSAEEKATASGGERIALTFTVNSDREGNKAIDVRGEEVTLDGRTLRASFNTILRDKETHEIITKDDNVAYEITGKSLAWLFHALGVGPRADDGGVDVVALLEDDVFSTELILEYLAEAEGTPLGAKVRTRNRRNGKKLVLNDDSKPIRDSEPVEFCTLEALAEIEED